MLIERPTFKNGDDPSPGESTRGASLEDSFFSFPPLSWLRSSTASSSFSSAADRRPACLPSGSFPGHPAAPHPRMPAPSSLPKGTIHAQLRLTARRSFTDESCCRCRTGGYSSGLHISTRKMPQRLTVECSIFLLPMTNLQNPKT
jgi:hypothetical protein